MKCLSVAIQMKATEEYFPVVLFVMLYKLFEMENSRTLLAFCANYVSIYFCE